MGPLSRTTRGRLVVATALALALGGLPAPAAAAELDPVACIDASGQPDCAAQMPAALGSPVQVAAAPGATHAYAVVTGRTGAAIDALVHFRRAPDGRLSFADCVAARAGYGCAVSNLPAAMADLSRIVVSDDGADVYAAARYGQAVLHFRVDAGGSPRTGTCLGDSAVGCSEPAEVDLRGWEPVDLALSSDGGQVYVAAQDAPELSVLRRGADGRLSLQGCVGLDVACDVPPQFCTAGDGCRTTDGLASPRALAVSPDGRAVYVASSYNNSRGRNAVAHFRRDGDGDPHYSGCVGEFRGCAPLPAGATLTGPRGIVVAPDSRTVYVGTKSDSDPGEASIARLRAAADGRLSFADCIGSGANNCVRPPGRAPAALWPWSVAVTPDGQDLYVGHLYHLKLAVDGSMSWNGCWGGGFGCRLLGIGSANRATTTVSGDGRNVYSASEDRIWTMTRPADQPPPGAGSPPEVIADPAYNVDRYSASLTARVRSQAGPAAVHFEVGRTTSYELGAGRNDASVPQSDSYVSVGDARYALRPDTTYHYRVVARNRAGVTVSGDRTFRTTPGVNSAPLARTEGVNSVGRDYATLNGVVQRHEDTTIRFEYGTSPSYGSSVAVAAPFGETFGSFEQWVNATLTGLQPDRTYYFRLVATGPSGTAYGAQQTFRTNAQPTLPPAPGVDAARATDLDPNAATLRATVDPGGSRTTWRFEHGPTRDLGLQAPASDGVLSDSVAAGEVSARITGLSPGSQRFFRVVATGPGGRVEGRLIRFTVPTEQQPPPPPPPPPPPSGEMVDIGQETQPRDEQAPTPGAIATLPVDSALGNPVRPESPAGTGLPQAFAVTLRAPRQRLRDVLARGLLVDVRSARPAALRIDVTIKPRSTRFTPRSRAARAAVSVGSTGKRFRVKLPARMRSGLRRATRTTFVVRATATARAGGQTESAQTVVPVRR